MPQRLAMKSVEPPRSWLRRLAGRLRRRTTRQVAERDKRERQRPVLSEVGAELDRAVACGVSPRLLLPQMLQALGLRTDRLQSIYPRTLVNLKAICAQCLEKDRCRRELDAATARSNLGEFCPNAIILAALMADAEREETRQGHRDETQRH